MFFLPHKSEFIKKGSDLSQTLNYKYYGLKRWNYLGVGKSSGFPLMWMEFFQDVSCYQLCCFYHMCWVLSSCTKSQSCTGAQNLCFGIGWSMCAKNMLLVFFLFVLLFHFPRWYIFRNMTCDLKYRCKVNWFSKICLHILIFWKLD